MCGIIGYIGGGSSIDVMMEGLKRLEYRGYDSAGIAFIDEGGTLGIIRAEGKITSLAKKIDGKTIKSSVGIGHTRWATHGSPTENNAHPHRAGAIALVHNGIIENFMELKSALRQKGVKFTSDTDTEVICLLINDFYESGLTFEDSVHKAVETIRGSYAIAVMNEREPDKIICVRKDSPLVIGLGQGEYYVASDVPAFLSYTRDVIFMNDGDVAVLTIDGVTIYEPDGGVSVREPFHITWSPSMAEKGGYRHFMLKEIFEQPRAISDTIAGRVNAEKSSVNLYEFGIGEEVLGGISRIFITACGTSWHAALCGKYMIEDIARVPVEVDIASEFRYRKPLIRKGDLLITITQSGETADTLAAMKEAKKLGVLTLSICNVLGSTASRESDYVFYTHSGPEIGVASTKSFVAQLIALYLLAVGLMQAKGGAQGKRDALINDLLHVPSLVEDVLLKCKELEELARSMFKARDFLYLGRGILYPIALEGALKLKEISYIHAEGYPAGEMKHGPIALIDEEMPVVVLLSKDHLFEKVISNIEEVKTRGGKTVVFSNVDEPGIREVSDYFFLNPASNMYLNPVIMAVPLQLLAYYIAVFRGCDVDQPRNLAKSVTVE
ncbi:MAG: glutamine--fructose-6-phosphate transaminase (isomerizing) [Candidatus Magnetoovum sp. WYHC-5]|nr:glutamine--fructose-6-phosphate transaminase (isomerizing) [Candidatus Magnetoovum sp. WYHC-5]